MSYLIEVAQNKSLEIMEIISNTNAEVALEISIALVFICGVFTALSPII
jgi:hypothetical protein|tara:strand:+ start:464 stop:610 length:147 start_codon:yes stop_codon:yes gene_type:complete